MLDLAKQTLERCSTSAAERAWGQLMAAGTPDVHAALAGLDDGERFVITLAVGLARPELAAPLGRAFVAARAPGTRFEARDFVDWSTAHRWLAAGGEALEVRELLKLFEGSAWMLTQTALRRAEAGKLDDTREIHAAIDALSRSEKAVAGVAVARCLAARGEDPAATLRLAIGDAAAPPYIQDGGEEVRALGVLLRELAKFLPPGHEAVREAVSRTVELGRDYSKGMTYEQARACEACADAATPDAPGWLEHAVAISKNLNGIDQAAGARLNAARARVAGQPAASAPAPDAKGPSYTLEELEQTPQLSFRAWKGLWLGAWRLEAGDRDGALEAFWATPRRPRAKPSPMLRAQWFDALADTGAADAAADALLEAMAELPNRLAGEVFARLERLRSPQLERVSAAVFARGAAWWSTGSPTFDPSAVDALVDAALASGSATAAAALFDALDAMKLGASWDEQTFEKRRVRHLDRLATLAGRTRTPAPDVERDIAAALARGEWPAALVATLDSRHQAAVSALGVELRLTTKRLGRSDDDEDGSTERWRHHLARVQLEQGALDAAVTSCAQMRDCRISGYGPGVLAMELAHALTERQAWNAARADKLAGVLSSRNVLPQDLVEPVLAVLPPAWDLLRNPGERARSIAAAFGGFQPDRACIDLAQAKAHARAKRWQQAGEAFERALVIAETGGLYFVGPAVFLAALREHAELPAWERSWQRSVALYRRFAPHDAARGVRAQVEQLTAREWPLVAATLEEAWPDDVRQALVDGVAVAVARGYAEAAVVRSLFERAKSLPEAQRATVAAACLARRQGRHDEAAQLAKLGGLS